MHIKCMFMTNPLPNAVFLSLVLSSWSAAEPASDKAAKCVIRADNDADPKISVVYEEKTYAFCSEECRKKFSKDRADSLYQQVGGAKAVGAVIDLFYKKIMADDRVNHHFDDTHMPTQIAKQKAFVSAALGSPVPWTGRSMRKAHKHLKLTEKDFGIIASHLQNSLQELKVKKEHIAQIMAVVGSVKGEVLNQKPTE